MQVIYHLHRKFSFHSFFFSFFWPDKIVHFGNIMRTGWNRRLFSVFHLFLVASSTYLLFYIISFSLASNPLTKIRDNLRNLKLYRTLWLSQLAFYLHSLSVYKFLPAVLHHFQVIPSHLCTIIWPSAINIIEQLTNLEIQTSKVFRN